MTTASCEQYSNAKKGVVGKNFLGERIERKARGGRLTSSQREAGRATELRPRMENPKAPPPTQAGHFAFLLLYFAYILFFCFCPRMGPAGLEAQSSAQ